jgi:alkaline phosphatase D
MIWFHRFLARRVCAALIGATALIGAACAVAPSPAVPTSIDISVGEVTERSALVWIGGSAGQRVRLQWRGESDGGARSAVLSRHGTAHVPLDGLQPGTSYAVTAFVDDGVRPDGVAARFRTAPPAHSNAPVKFLFSGDLAGQNACRDATLGFPVFAALDGRDADFFIGLGDMIYADGACEAIGAFGNAQIARIDRPLLDIASFSDRWRYNFEDPGFRRLRRRMAYVPVWDDHEIVNDFGPHTARLPAAPDVDLLAVGRDAFVLNNPVAHPPAAPGRLYRRFRVGRHAEFFVLDTRQYRDDNALDDIGVLPKSLLGAAQRRWLIDGLAVSNATWKFVISSVPITIPTGWPVENGRDGWASGDGDGGFERELHAIFQALAKRAVAGLVFLSTDIHFATGFRLQPLPRQPQFVVHELLVGPLSAGMFAHREVDPTFAPRRLYFHGLESPATTLGQALRGFNFGAIDIDHNGALTFELVDGHGDTVHEMTLSP